MGIFKNLFLKEEDSSKKEDAKEQAPAEQVELENGETAEFNFSFTDAGEQGAPDEGVFNQEIYEHLLQVIQSANNSTGLKAFVESLENLKAVKMPESAKYQSAFITLKTAQGLTKEDLVKAINDYLLTLEAEKVKFEAAAEAKKNTEVGGREQEKENNLASIEEKSQQIQKLTEEIQGLTQRNEELDHEIIEEQNGITSSVSNFNATADVLEAELVEDRDNIEKYLATKTEEA